MNGILDLRFWILDWARSVPGKLVSLFRGHSWLPGFLISSRRWRHGGSGSSENAVDNDAAAVYSSAK